MTRRILYSWLVYMALITKQNIIGAYAQQLTTATTTTTGTTPGTTTTTSAAVTSLYIPGFDPQPVSADVIGVDGAGRTTWAIHRGSATGMDTGLGNFLGTATLVEGAQDASLTYANAEAQFTIGMQCTFSESTLAVCTIEAQGSRATQTEFIFRQPIQGGETLAPTLVPGAASSTAKISSSGSGASATTASSTSSATIGAGDASTTMSPAPSNTSGSSGRRSYRGSVGLWGVGLAMPYLVWGSRLF